MKVTTDACLSGAVTVTEFIEETHQKILDIGTGTGLLSLMIAQKNKQAQIDAVEIDEAAAIQATNNIAASAFASQINVYQSNIKQFEKNHAYDFVVTNPPFFEKDLKSESVNRNMALHDASLTLDELLKQIDRLIKSDGLFSILLPYHRSNYFVTLAGKLNWFCSRQVLVKQTEKHDCFRSILLFKKNGEATETTNITIKKNDEYSNSFKILLKDYYLYL